MNKQIFSTITKMKPQSNLSFLNLTKLLHLLIFIPNILCVDVNITNLTEGCVKDGRKADDFLNSDFPCTFYKEYLHQGATTKRSRGQNGVFNVKIKFVPHLDGGKDQTVFSKDPRCHFMLTSIPTNSHSDQGTTRIVVPCHDIRKPVGSSASESRPAQGVAATLYERDIPSRGGTLKIQGFYLPSDTDSVAGSYQLIVSVADDASSQVPDDVAYDPQNNSLEENATQRPLSRKKRRSTAGRVAKIGAGIIAAIVICCLICCGLVTGLCFWCCCRGGSGSAGNPAWARGMPAVFRSDQAPPAHTGRAEGYDPSPQQSYPVYPKLNEGYGDQGGGAQGYQGYPVRGYEAPNFRSENPPMYTPSAPVDYANQGYHPQGGR